MDTMVLDATMGCRDGLYCFCPVELDDDGQITAVITGLIYLSPALPENQLVVAVVHEGGSDAAEEFCENNPEIMELINGQGKAA